MHVIPIKHIKKWHFYFGNDCPFFNEFKINGLSLWLQQQKNKLRFGWVNDKEIILFIKFQRYFEVNVGRVPWWKSGDFETEIKFNSFIVGTKWPEEFNKQQIRAKWA